VTLSAWDAAAIAVKALGYAGTLGAAGAIFFLKLCDSLIGGADRRGIRRLILRLIALSLLAGAAQILVTAGAMGGDAADMLNLPLVHMVWRAGLGRAFTIRAIGLLLAAAAVMSERPSWPALIGAVLSAASFAGSGHAHALSPNGPSVALLTLHLLGVAFWLGALAPLSLIAGRGDTAALAAAAARFGSAALFVVGGLVIAGAALLWMLLRGFTETWASSYGRLVTFKLVLVAGLLCLAAFNKLRLTPRLLANESIAIRSLRASIRIEMILGAAILLVTATFTTVTGPPALN
jgi:copper resistance protein D